jgi:ASCH domain
MGALSIKPMKGLIIDEPWLGMIIAGKKTWEMRSKNTLIRGRIALIRKGSKAVIGVADLVGTVPKLSRSELQASVAKHQVPESEIEKGFKHNTAWVLERARPLHQPVPYCHPAGAVIWVNLDPQIAAAIDGELADA